MYHLVHLVCPHQIRGSKCDQKTVHEEVPSQFFVFFSNALLKLLTLDRHHLEATYSICLQFLPYLTCGVGWWPALRPLVWVQCATPKCQKAVTIYEIQILY